MRCQYCGGQVVWMGPLSQLTHTECQDCGRTNCQEPDGEFTYDEEEQEDEQQRDEP